MWEQTAAFTGLERAVNPNSRSSLRAGAVDLRRLKKNILLNQLEGRVRCENMALSARAEGDVIFARSETSALRAPHFSQRQLAIQEGLSTHWSCTRRIQVSTSMRGEPSWIATVAD